MDFLSSYPPPCNFPQCSLFTGHPALAFVEGNTQEDHKDDGDARNAYCIITPLGKFKGADLVFRDLGLRVPLHSGDIAIFRSHLLTHSSTRIIKGRRFIIVSYADHNLYGRINVCKSKQPIRNKRRK